MRLPRTATVIIALITAALWLVVEALGLQDNAALLMGVVPVRLSGELALSPAVPELLTPLSATLVHGGFFHLALNLLMLVWCGTSIERVLGWKSLAILYVVGAYAAALAQWAVEPASLIPMIGASGAISAVIGAFAISFGRPKQVTRSPKLNRWINAAWLLAAWIVLQLLSGMLGGQQGVMLATPAHIGGFVAGLLLQRPLLMWRYRNA
ncbi:MAG: rhomboid family intramembrane serine protease [Pseudomonadota bacterium]|nr:rhomboid family intramembrane serine protease [Pseudomonadota bacterium]